MRERSDQLLAAGYAPCFRVTPLDDPDMGHILASLRPLPNAHEPYPGLILDRRWNVMLAKITQTQAMLHTRS